MISIDGLLPSYSQWVHKTRLNGNVVSDIYGHPVKFIRSFSKFSHHVAEHILANEAAIRVKIAAAQPDNAENNRRISDGVDSPIIRRVCDPLKDLDQSDHDP
ncbi:hypothetical protein D6D22_00725 [Aureobasidium pullulans]|uniref:Uncharacterized protein n=1 Tax=Aureobasidium pullulans TaxID=5580 RepID=A0A4V4IKS4_AURPU|nr:hypothetical protein D6D22_00725 [Aureobasidium pullulans]